MNEQLKVIISAEISKFKQGVAEAQSKINAFKQQVEKAKKNVDDNFKKIGEFAVSAGKKIATAFAAAAGALLALGGSTTEARNQQAQLITAFEAAGGSAAEATETYNSLYRVLGDGGQAQEAAQHLAKLTTEEKALSEWTNICQGVYATFGASLPIESLTEAANETAKTGQLTGSLADALNWAGVSEEAFQKKLDACNTEAEREALIRETLNGEYAEAAALYEQNNASVLAQRDAQAQLQEQLNLLGEAVAPIITAFTQFATDALAIVVPYIQQLAEQYGPLLNEALAAMGTALENTLNWMTQNKDVLAALAIAIGIIVSAIGLYNAVAAIKAAMAALEVASVWGLVAAYAAQAVAMMAALLPYILIAAAIAALIVVIVLCIKYWDEIKAAAGKAWEWIKQKWSEAGEWFGGVVDSIKQVFANIGQWFSNLFSNAWNGIKTAWGSVKSWFSNLWTGIKGVFNSVKTWFGNIFSNAWSSIKNAFSGVSSFFTGIWNSITGIFRNAGSVIGGAIKGAVSTAVNAILSTAVSIINGFIGAINFAIGIINAIPGVSISTLSLLSVPAMAQGGVVDGAQLAMIGEAGAEAVVPLENNLGWLDKLAGMLNDRMGGNTPSKIVLEVDGKVFAETSIESINQLTEHSGKLGLIIV